MDPQRSQFRTIYRAPAVLALSTCVGLVSGVFGDGLRDGISWLGLGIPLGVLLRFTIRPYRGRLRRNRVTADDLRIGV